MAWSSAPNSYLTPPAGAAQRFAYDAITDKKRRRAPALRGQHESKIAGSTERRKLIATAQDQRRNLSLVAWAWRLHLAFNTRFNFHATTNDRGLNRELEAAMRWYNRAGNCDVKKRHTLERTVRLLEGHRFIDGDVGSLFTDDGRLQLIEGERIAAPSRGVIPDAWRALNWSNGVAVDANGAATHYMICTRDGQSLVFDGVREAGDMRLHGYFDRDDQTRGISPLTTAVNTFQDVYEAWELNMLKAKAHALFGVVVNRDSGGRGDFPMDAKTDDDATTSDVNEERYHWKPDGVFKMEMEPGDSISTVQSSTPSSEFVDYTTLLCQVGLLAMDLPVTFFDGRKASYSSQRMDLILYVLGAYWKREPLIEYLDLLTTWKLARFTGRGRNLAINEPAISLPLGMDYRQLSWEWVPVGIPWIDPRAEVAADERLVRNGFVSRQYIAKHRGLRDWWQTVEELAEEQNAMTELGVHVQIADPGAVTAPGADSAAGLDDDADNNNDNDNERDDALELVG